MNQLYTIDLVNIKVIDAVAADKIFPPHFRTVQNKQPIPEGAFKKRDGLASADVVTSSKKWECQLITPFFLKGSAIADTIAAFSDETTPNLCHLFKYVGTTWSQITSTSTTPESSIVDDGFYYVTNALSLVSTVLTPVLVLVKAETTNAAWNSNTEKNCCYFIYRNPANGVFTVKSVGNDASTVEPTIQTLNWQSATCAEYHLNKLWVGGIREPDNPELIAAADNLLVNRHNRIRWSKTGSIDANYSGVGAGNEGSWGGSGTGYLDVPVTGEHLVVGMRSFRGKLYVLTTSDLFVVTGTTSDQFGLTRLLSTPSAIGLTMWASDDYLFWADANGIHQFNGSSSKNITEDTVPVAYKQKQIEQYNQIGTGVATGYGKVPTAFINEKLKIYGIHWPDLSSANYSGSPNLAGKETWLYNYKAQTFSTYVYNLESNYNDVNYISDYHDTGFIWMGLSNTAEDNPVAAKYTFEPSTDDTADPNGAVTTILETGDLNLASLNGFSYEDVIKLNRVDFYAVPDSSTAITYKLDITVDNTAQTQQTVSVAAVSGATQPQHYVVPLPTTRAGSFFKFTITEDTASVKGDLRRVDLFYEIMFKRGAGRK